MNRVSDSVTPRRASRSSNVTAKRVANYKPRLSLPNTSNDADNNVFYCEHGLLRDCVKCDIPIPFRLTVAGRVIAKTSPAAGALWVRW